MANYVSKLQTVYNFTGLASGSINGQATDTGNNFSTSTQTFPAASTNASMTMAFTKANLQSFYLVADQNCTVKTNSSGTPQDTITLVAGIPYVWSLSSGLTNPFGGNVTTAFLTCTPATTVKMGILQS